MEFRLLGPFEIAASEPVAISRRRERGLLAVLLLEQGHTVQAHRLAELLWDDDPPVSARTALSSHVSRLRATLGSVLQITRQGAGYRLRTDPERIDVHRFRSLVRQAGGQPDPGPRADLLRTALGLWRGPVLADVTSDPVRARLGAELEELRLVALDQRIEAELAIGRHTELLGELRELVATHVNRERFTAHLMLALYRSQRQAEALGVYDNTRRALAGVFALRPGSELRDLHARILSADPALDLPVRTTAAEPVPRPQPNDVRQLPTPRQLPHGMGEVIGRTSELAELDNLATHGTGQGATIVSIDGAPGTGKTTLAVHWAHRVAERFPDAQLYLNLRGHGPGDPLAPAAAAETLLRGLGVDNEVIPAGVDERTALLRSTLAGRRVLMLLDNARDSDQVRPLLPATTALVVVTSRAQLRGLSVRDGARRMTLRRLPRQQAVELLAASIGSRRVNAEPQASARLVELCDRLPLALAIVAERAHRSGTVFEVADALADERERLDLLGVGTEDPHTDVRAALSWSYRALDPDAATMFRALGLNPADDIAPRAAAALADLPVPRATEVLDQLVAANLAEQRRPGRYELHDLVRLYAAELAHAHADAADRHAAVTRLLDDYLHAAASADTRLMTNRRHGFLDPYRPSRPPPEFANRAEATAWFEHEHPVLCTLVPWAASNGWPGHSWRLAMASTTFFDCRIPWRDGLAFLKSALRAAESDDRTGTAYVLNSLGCIHLDKGELSQAISHFERSLAVFGELSHQPGEMMVRGNIGLANAQLGNADEAHRHSTIALEMCQRHNYRRGIALNLDNLGVALTVSGDYDAAIASYLQADKINADLNDSYSQATTLHHLGWAYSGRGDHHHAARTLRQAIALYRALGNRRWEAIAITDFARLLHKLGHCHLARTMWQTALATMTQLNDPRAQEIRTDLATCG